MVGGLPAGFQGHRDQHNPRQVCTLLAPLLEMPKILPRYLSRSAASRASRGYEAPPHLCRGSWLNINSSESRLYHRRRRIYLEVRPALQEACLASIVCFPRVSIAAEGDLQVLFAPTQRLTSTPYPASSHRPCISQPLTHARTPTCLLSLPHTYTYTSFRYFSRRLVFGVLPPAGVVMV